MYVASSCFDSLVRCSALELCLFLPMHGLRSTMDDFLAFHGRAPGSVPGIKTYFPDAPLRSGNRPKPQHWKLDESTEVEETPAEEDQDWNDDIDADWTIDSEGRSSLSEGSVCALVASDGQASLRRSISETDLLVSEEEVNQTFACWKEDLVGITGLCGPFVDKLLLANVRDHGWDTGQYLSEVLVAGFEESDRKTDETYRKVFTRARLALPCAAPRGVETCVLFAVIAFWATLSGRVATFSTVLVSQRGSECRSCVDAPNAIGFMCTAESCLMSQCRVLR